MCLLIKCSFGFGLLLSTAAGEQPITLAQRLAKADVILVGTVESAKRIPESDPRSRLQPIEALRGVPQYGCEVTVRVAAPMKGGIDVSHDKDVGFVWYLSSPACVADRWGDPAVLQKPALWLLRRQDGFLRALTDNGSTVIPLQSFPPAVERRLGEWSEPNLALTYLFLKPGVVIPEAEFSNSTLQGELIYLGGWRDFLTVYRVVFLESSDRVRGQIAKSVARIGQCLDLAKRTAVTEGSLAELGDVDLEGRGDERQSRRMSWNTKEEMLRAFETPKDALDELTIRACGTAPKTRQRAREMLVEYFAVDPATLPCIPCEGK